MYRVGDFSKLSGLTIDTLYHYENIKILSPCRIDNFTGNRYYEALQLLTVNKILALKDANFSLQEISNILNNNISTAHLVEMLEGKAQSLESTLNSEYSRLQRLHTNIDIMFDRIKQNNYVADGHYTIKVIGQLIIPMNT